MYEIANYDELYRPYDKSGGELKRADWVKVPAKPKGDGLQKLLEYKRGGEIFSIWILLLEKATTEKRPKNRGKLLNHKGEAASISEIAKSISHKGKERLVKYALSILVIMGWVDCDKQTEETPAELPPTSAKSSVEKSKVKESKYTESFEKFWKGFKGRWNPKEGEYGSYNKGSKIEAFAEWERLSQAEQQKATKGAPFSAGEFTQDCCRWLKGKRWEK